jgi:hypothetical protein
MDARSRRQRYPSDMCDAEWQLIKGLIPPEVGGGRHRDTDMRAVVDGILYLPQFPRYRVVLTFYREWAVLMQTESSEVCLRTKAWASVGRQDGRPRGRIMSPLVQGHRDFVVGDHHRGGGVEQIVKDGLGLRSLVEAAHLFGHEPVQGTGHERDLQVKIDFQADHGGQGIEMKEVDRFGNAVLNEHALRVACHQGHKRDGLVVGQQNGGFFMAEIDHGHLPQFPVVAAQPDAFLQDLGGSIGRRQGRQRNALPG